MRVVSWPDFLSGRQRFQRPVSLTIGVFDGLHIGHRKLIELVTEDRARAAPLVVTFPRSPAQVLDPARFPGLILSWPQRLSRLAELGVEGVVEIDFSDEMSNLSGKAFISLLKENLTIEKIVVGYNFRFGRAREAGSGDLKEMLVDTGIDVRVTDPVLRGSSTVSSSRIRKTIQEGDFAEARAMLLADYCLDMRGVSRRATGPRTLVFERSGIGQVIPAAGRYEVSLECGGRARQAELTVSADALTLAVEEPAADVAAIVFN